MKTIATFTALAAVAIAVPAHAEFALDDRYVDNDGDLIADIPEDSADWVDPDTLIFAYTPVDPGGGGAGRPALSPRAQPPPAERGAGRAGRLHVAGFNTGR